MSNDQEPEEQSGGLRWGGISLFPSLEASTIYDSNISLRETQRRRDIVSSLRPSLIGRLGFGDYSSLNLKYAADYQRYSRTKAFDAHNNFISLGSHLGPPSGYFLAMSTYQKTNDRAPTLIERVDREETFWQFGSGRRSDSFRTEARVQGFQRLYGEQLRALEYRSLSFTPQMTLLLDEDRRLLTDASAEKLNYMKDSARDGNEFQWRLGGEYGDEERPLFHVVGGVKSRQYDGAGLGRFYGFVGEASGNLHVEGKTILEAVFSTDGFDSLAEPSSGYYREYRGRLGATYRLTSRVTWVASQALARQRYGGSTSRINFSGRRRDRVDSTSLRGYYALSSYVAVYLGFNYEHRKSNVPLQSYSESSMIGGVRIGL